MDQSKTSDRGQGDGGPDIISGAVSKGLQGIREVGKAVRPYLRGYAAAGVSRLQQFDSRCDDDPL